MIADFFLLSTSMHLFLVLQDKALRIRLSCLFSTCVFTTVVSIVNFSFVIASESMKIVIITIVEVTKIYYFFIPVIADGWMALRAAYQ